MFFQSIFFLFLETLENRRFLLENVRIVKKMKISNLEQLIFFRYKQNFKVAAMVTTLIVRIDVLNTLDLNNSLQGNICFNM
jgi:hypothetical protein